jgi:hypothetical protein
MKFNYSKGKGSDLNLDPHSLWIGIEIQLESSAADPASGSGTFCQPGYGMKKNPNPGSEMSIPDHFSDSLGTVFRVKILFDADPNLGSGGMKKFGSWINIPDPQHCLNLDPGSRNNTEHRKNKDMSCIIKKLIFVLN